jgi:flagellar hook assembly protein FlgD
MTGSGILVAAIQARGKQALWDGRDVRGELVPPGVYLVSASSATTNTSAVGKIAVTR